MSGTRVGGRLRHPKIALAFGQVAPALVKLMLAPSIPRILLLAAAASLAACATPQRRDVYGGEFPEVARNCGYPQARLVPYGLDERDYYLDFSAQPRDPAADAGRVACLLHWGRERGLRIGFRGAEPIGEPR